MIRAGVTVDAARKRGEMVVTSG